MVIGILSIEKGTNYFESGAVLPILATIWAMIAFIAAVIFAIIIPKEEIEAKSPFGSDLLTALPATLGFGVGAIFMVIEFAKSQKILFLIAYIVAIFLGKNFYALGACALVFIVVAAFSGVPISALLRSVYGFG